MLTKFLILNLTILTLISCEDNFQQDPIQVGDNEVITSPMQSDDTTPPTGSSAIRSGTFIGNSQYTVNGDAELFYDPATDTYSLFFASNFSSSGGPDLRVYLSNSGTVDANGVSLELGALKKNNGVQRYDFPASDYDAGFTNIVIWCEAFSVLFGNASF